MQVKSDPFGIQPLYYTLDKNQALHTANTVQQLLDKTNNDKLDQEYLAEMLTLGLVAEHTYSDRTIYQGIKKALPGHQLIFKHGIVTQQRVWQLENSPRVHFKKRAEYSEAFKEKFIQAVARCTQKHTNFAIELSGGLDSGSIAAIARPQITGELLALTNAPTKATAQKYRSYKSELAYAQAICQQLKLPQHLIQQHFALDTALDKHTSDLPGYLESSFAFLNTEHYAFAKQQGCQAILSGFGGDQLITSGFAQLLKEMRYTHPISAAINFINYKKHQPKELLKYLAKEMFRKPAPRSLAKRYQALYPFLQPKLKQYLIERTQDRVLFTNHQQELRSFIPGLGEYSGFIASRVECASQVLRHYQMPIYFPMLDQELVEFCYGCPLEVKYKWLTDRYLIRQAMQSQLPKRVLKRKDKAGHTIPGQYIALQQAFLRDMQKPNILKQFKELLGDYINVDYLAKQQTLPLPTPVINLYLNFQLMRSLTMQTSFA